VDLLFKSSDLIEKIHIYDSFYNIESLDIYIENHLVYLTLYKTDFDLDEFENIKNITSLKMKDVYVNISLNSFIRIQNIRALTLINCNYEDNDYFFIMNELKKITYLRIIFYDIDKIRAKKIYDMSLKYENIKKIEIEKYEE
ncbi:5410_t:CDS:1, partial [Scutellospora calospora]